MSESELVTIPEALRASANGDARIEFHLEDGRVTLTAADLLERAGVRAAMLIERGVGPGDAIGLVGSNRPQWVEWAYATWLAGGTLVPLPAPVRTGDPKAYADQVHALATAMKCALVVAEPRYRKALDEEGTLDWDVKTPTGRAQSQVEHHVPPLDSIAIVLCTSGSTSMPKGVMLDHRGIASREWFRSQSATALQDELLWVPLFHTGGLFSIITPIYQGLVAHCLPAERFARDPLSWFRAISEVRAQGTGAASSAWLAALRAAQRKPDGIDLSSLRVARFGLEMIDPDVLDLCTTVGVRFGLSPKALWSAYGMSEGVGLSYTVPGEGVGIDTIDLEELVSSRRAVPATGGLTKRVASCGRVGRGVEMRIIGPDGSALAEREVGEITFRSAMMMRGYLGHDDTGFTSDGWFATGDVGYLADGELFLTGRVKEIIISKGHNYHPEDIERAAAAGLDVAPERCVAFAKPGGEGVAIIVVEAVEGVDPQAAPGVIRRAVATSVGALVTEVVVVAPDSIPRTPTGKMKRTEARAMLQEGRFHLAG